MSEVEDKEKYTSEVLSKRFDVLCLLCGSVARSPKYKYSIDELDEKFVTKKLADLARKHLKKKHPKAYQRMLEDKKLCKNE